VLLYQGWTYWVFRQRLGREDFAGAPTPIAALRRLAGKPADDQAPPPAA